MIDDLERRAMFYFESSPQRLVPSDDLIDNGFQRIEI